MSTKGRGLHVAILAGGVAGRPRQRLQTRALKCLPTDMRRFELAWLCSSVGRLSGGVAIFADDQVDAGAE
jgi:hypothetical protein